MVNISKTQQLTPKQSRWINSTTSKGENMHFIYWCELSFQTPNVCVRNSDQTNPKNKKNSNIMTCYAEIPNQQNINVCSGNTQVL